MNRGEESMNHRTTGIYLLLPVFCLQILLVSCTPEIHAVVPPTTVPLTFTAPAQSGTPVEQITGSPTLTPHPTFTPTPITTVQPTIGQTPVVMKDGPHLVFFGSKYDADMDSLWITDAGYSQFELLTDHVLRTQNIEETISPDRSKIAVLEVRNDYIDLNIVSTSTGKKTNLAEVYSYGRISEKYGDDEADNLANYLRVSWSSDSLLLAFLSLDKSSQLILSTYSLTSGKITEYSGYPGSAVFPSFSPDGNRIIFFTEHEIISGSDHEMTGLWRLKLGTGDVSRLEDLTDQGCQQLLGWLDNRRIVITAGSDEKQNLRIVDIVTKEQQYLNKSQIHDAAITSNGGVIYSTANHVYYTTENESQRKIIIDGLFWRIIGDQNRNIFILINDDGSAVVVDKNGNILKTIHDEIDSFISFGNQYAYSSPPVWIDSVNHDEKHLVASDAQQLLWDKNGNLLFFKDEVFWKVVPPDYSHPTLLLTFSGIITGLAWMK
jgi:hypothetical protein